MLLLLALYPLLLAVLTGAGSVILSALAPSCVLRLPDRLFLSYWLGIFGFAGVLLFTAAFSPLSPRAGIAPLLVICLMALRSAEARRDLRSLTSAFNRPFAAALILIIALHAVVGSFPGSDIDTGSYHFTAVRWLTEAGAAPGLALLEHRLGFSSSLFALSAVMNHGFIAGRSHGIALGLISIGFLLQCIVMFFRMMQGVAARSDLFLLGFFLLVWPFRSLAHGVSPNAAVTLALGTLAWLAVLLFSRSSDEPPGPTASNDERSVLLLSYIAALAALKATTVVALPLAILLTGRSGLRAFLRRKHAVLWSMIMLSGPILHAFITTGCPLYPVVPWCASVDWALVPEEVQRAQRIVFDYAVCGHAKSCHLPWLARLRAWLTENTVAVFLVALDLLALARHRRISAALGPRLAWWLIASWLAGMLMLVRAGPSLTFGLGWLALPAAALALEAFQVPPLRALTVGAIMLAAAYPRLSATRFHGAVFLGNLTLVFCALVLPAIRRPAAAERTTPCPPRLRLATALFAIALIAGTGVDISYRHNASRLSEFVGLPSLVFDEADWAGVCAYEQLSLGEIAVEHPTGVSSPDWNMCGCWNHGLVCSSEPTVPCLKLRSPEKGALGGFSRCI